MVGTPTVLLADVDTMSLDGCLAGEGDFGLFLTAMIRGFF